MTATAGDAGALPDIGAILAPLFAAVPAEHRPLLLAIAERMAARRYRAWADEPDLAAHRAALLACADREEAIATRAEARYPDAAAVQAGLRAAHPELEVVNRDIFAGRPLAQQLTIQARGERLGAATWRAFAELDAARRDTFLACPPLEEDNARALEAILAGAR